MGISYITSFSTVMRHETCGCQRKIGRHLLPTYTFLHIYCERITKTSVCISFLRPFLPLPVYDGTRVAPPFSLFLTCSSMLSVFLELTAVLSNIYSVVHFTLLSFVFTFYVTCVEVRYDIPINNDWFVSTPSVTCIADDFFFKYLRMFPCNGVKLVLTKWLLFCVLFVFVMCVVYLMPVSLECPVLIAAVVFSNVYLWGVYRNLQLLNNIIMIKDKVLLPQT